MWAVLVVLIARATIVYGLSWVANLLAIRTRRPWLEPVPPAWQHVLNWGGLRGAISLALALTLPAALGPDQVLVRTMAFGVVLFTLLIQGVTMGPLVRRLKIVTRRETQIEYEARHARLTALRAAERHLDHLHRAGLLSSHAWETLKPELARQADSLAHAVREALHADPSLEAKELAIARRERLQAERSTFADLRRKGVISEEVFEKLSTLVDAQLADLNQDGQLARDGTDDDNADTSLMAADPFEDP